MAFKVKIKNIGKLADAEIHIGDFTVFAGPNNTGKSFVSKLLYSLFNAMNANHAETHLNNLLEPVKRSSYMISRDRWMRSDEAIRSWQSSLENETKKLETLVKEVSIDALDETIPDLISQTEQMQQIAADIPISTNTTMVDRLGRRLPSLTDSLTELQEQLHRTDAEDFVGFHTLYQRR